MADNRTSRTQRARAREDWAPRFLDRLGEAGMVAVACDAAGIGRQTAYDRRKRDEDFARAWDEILARTDDELEYVATRRAIDGSDNLLTFLLRHRRPEVYGDRREVRHTGPAGGRVEVKLKLDGKGRKALADVLRERPATRPE